MVRENKTSEGVTDEELLAQLRINGIDDVARVKAASLESCGSVSVITKDDRAESGSTHEAMSSPEAPAPPWPT